MSIYPVNLPPGMYLDSTSHGRKGRWAHGNRVRWHDGSLRPIGGWERRTKKSDDADMPSIITIGTPTTETVRDLFFWDDPLGAIYGMAGSNLGLYYINENNEARNITPPGFVTQPKDPTILNGYGISIYGRGTYGTPRSASGALAIPAGRWALTNWGREGIAMSIQNGPIYRFTPGSATMPSAVPNAPIDNGGVIITDQRIMMVIDPDGVLGEDREVRWSDSEDYSVWAPDLTNQAGSQVLPGVGKLLSIHKVLGQVLVLSETDAQTCRYLGPPYIYGFERVGHACGPIGRFVCAVTDRFAMWLGDRQFWMYDGTVRPVECDVMDWFTGDFDFDWASAVSVHPVAEFNEVWWHYKSKDADEVDSYIAFNYVQKTWHVGRLDRTATVDQAPTRDPVYVDAAGFVFNHELKDTVVEDSYAVTGPLEIGKGEVNMAVRWIWPDTETIGDVNFTLLGRSMPTEDDRSFGPYIYRNPTPVRAFGREIRMRVDGQSGVWEVGPDMRLEVAEMGTGKR